MAPARLIHKRQQEILLGFLEDNKEMLNGMVGDTHTQENYKQKWTAIARKLNAVENGLVKSPIDWKKYWFLWRHRCLKKASIARRDPSGSNKLTPFTEQDMRLLKLCGKTSSLGTEPNSLHLESTEKSEDFQSTESIKVSAFPVTRVKPRSFATFSRAIQNHQQSDSESLTPPPKWALQIEERRIAAEERMAAALEAIASVMQSQEEHKTILHEKLTDSISSIAGTVQDINRGVQVALQILHQTTLLQTNGRDIKENFNFTSAAGFVVHVVVKQRLQRYRARQADAKCLFIATRLLEVTRSPVWKNK